ncbi:MAG TPA: hypothetical protein VGC37_08765 [Friedmanniella sp.]
MPAGGAVAKAGDRFGQFLCGRGFGCAVAVTGMALSAARARAERDRVLVPARRRGVHWCVCTAACVHG